MDRWGPRDPRRRDSMWLGSTAVHQEPFQGRTLPAQAAPFANEDSCSKSVMQEGLMRHVLSRVQGLEQACAEREPDSSQVHGSLQVIRGHLMYMDALQREERVQDVLRNAGEARLRPSSASLRGSLLVTDPKSSNRFDNKGLYAGAESFSLDDDESTISTARSQPSTWDIEEMYSFHTAFEETQSNCSSLSSKPKESRLPESLPQPDEQLGARFDKLVAEARQAMINAPAPFGQQEQHDSSTRAWHSCAESTEPPLGMFGLARRLGVPQSSHNWSLGMPPQAPRSPGLGSTCGTQPPIDTAVAYHNRGQVSQSPGSVTFPSGCDSIRNPNSRSPSCSSYRSSSGVDAMKFKSARVYDSTLKINNISGIDDNLTNNRGYGVDCRSGKPSCPSSFVSCDNDSFEGDSMRIGRSPRSVDSDCSYVDSFQGWSPTHPGLPSCRNSFTNEPKKCASPRAPEFVHYPNTIFGPKPSRNLTSGCGDLGFGKASEAFVQLGISGLSSSAGSTSERRSGTFARSARSARSGPSSGMEGSVKFRRALDSINCCVPGFDGISIQSRPNSRVGGWTQVLDANAPSSFAEGSAVTDELSNSERSVDSVIQSDSIGSVTQKRASSRAGGSTQVPVSSFEGSAAIFEYENDPIRSAIEKPANFSAENATQVLDINDLSRSVEGRTDEHQSDSIGLAVSQAKSRGAGLTQVLEPIDKGLSTDDKGLRTDVEGLTATDERQSNSRVLAVQNRADSRGAGSTQVLDANGFSRYEWSAATDEHQSDAIGRAAQTALTTCNSASSSLSMELDDLKQPEPNNRKVSTKDSDSALEGIQTNTGFGHVSVGFDNFNHAEPHGRNVATLASDKTGDGSQIKTGSVNNSNSSAVETEHPNSTRAGIQTKTGSIHNSDPEQGSLAQDASEDNVARAEANRRNLAAEDSDSTGERILINAGSVHISMAMEDSDSTREGILSNKDFLHNSESEAGSPTEGNFASGVVGTAHGSSSHRMVQSKCQAGRSVSVSDSGKIPDIMVSHCTGQRVSNEEFVMGRTASQEADGKNIVITPDMDVSFTLHDGVAQDDVGSEPQRSHSESDSNPVVGNAASQDADEQIVDTVPRVDVSSSLHDGCAIILASEKSHGEGYCESGSRSVMGRAASQEADEQNDSTTPNMCVSSTVHDGVVQDDVILASQVSRCEVHCESDSGLAIGSTASHEVDEQIGGAAPNMDVLLTVHNSIVQEGSHCESDSQSVVCRAASKDAEEKIIDTVSLTMHDGVAQEEKIIDSGSLTMHDGVAQEDIFLVSEVSHCKGNCESDARFVMGRVASQHADQFIGTAPDEDVFSTVYDGVSQDEFMSAFKVNHCESDCRPVTGSAASQDADGQIVDTSSDADVSSTALDGVAHDDVISAFTHKINHCESDSRSVMDSAVSQNADESVLESVPHNIMDDVSLTVHDGVAQDDAILAVTIGHCAGQCESDSRSVVRRTGSQEVDEQNIVTTPNMDVSVTVHDVVEEGAISPSHGSYYESISRSVLCSVASQDADDKILDTVPRVDASSTVHDDVILASKGRPDESISVMSSAATHEADQQIVDTRKVADPEGSVSLVQGIVARLESTLAEEKCRNAELSEKLQKAKLEKDELLVQSKQEQNRWELVDQQLEEANSHRQTLEALLKTEREQWTKKNMDSEEAPSGGVQNIDSGDQNSQQNETNVATRGVAELANVFGELATTPRAMAQPSPRVDLEELNKLDVSVRKRAAVVEGLLNLTIPQVATKSNDKEGVADDPKITVEKSDKDISDVTTEGKSGSNMPKGKGKGKGPGKGGPTPPPLPSKGTAPGGRPGLGGPPKAPAPRKPLVKPRVSMKRLFWSSFVLDEQLRSPRRSVWAAIDGEVDSAEFDADELERLFCERPCNHPSSSSSGGPSASGTAGARPSTIRVFDEKRRRQICVMCARLPALDKVLHAVLELDDMILNKDQVDLLALNVPASEDLELVRSAVANVSESCPPARLDSAEEFVLSLGTVPAFNLRLQIWAFENSFDERCETFTAGADDMLSACMVARTSQRLQRLLALALKVGNYLNGGTTRGRADGFSLEALVQMRTVKASAALQGSTTTLVDFLVHEIVRCRGANDLEELFAEGAEAEIIHQASRLKVADLVKELASYRTQAGNLAQQASEAVDDEVLLIRAERVALRCQELEDLKARFDSTDAEYKAVCEWFHVRDAKYTKAPEEFFAAWDTFLRDLKKSFEALIGAYAKRGSRKNSSKRLLKCSFRSLQTIKKAMGTPREALPEASVEAFAPALDMSVNSPVEPRSLDSTNQVAALSKPPGEVQFKFDPGYIAALSKQDLEIQVESCEEGIVEKDEGIQQDKSQEAESGIFKFTEGQPLPDCRPSCVCHSPCSPGAGGGA